MVVVLIASLTYLYNRHIRKQEDALATFALSEIGKQYSACLTQHHDPSEGCMQTTQQLREYMKTHFPNLQYFEIAATGHFLMLEKPDDFNHLLLEFLDKQTF